MIELWLHSRPASTPRAYRADVQRFREFVGKDLRQVTLADLQGFAESLASLKEASRYRCLSAVKSLFAFGHLLGYFPFDVGRVLRLPAVRNRLAERILPEAELHRMLSVEPDERNRLLLFLLYASGCRRAELAGIRWRDLQTTTDGGQITVFGEGGKTRSIQLPASLWKQLIALRGRGPVRKVFRCERLGSDQPAHLRGPALHGIRPEVCGLLRSRISGVVPRIAGR